MAITYVGKGTHVLSTGALVIPPPSGTQAGDLLLLIIQSPPSTIDTPSGWTAAANVVTISGQTSGRVFYKIAGASEGSVTTPDYGAGQRGIMCGWRGVDPINPINAVRTSTTAYTALTVLNPTSTVDEGMLVNCLSFYENYQSGAILSGWTNTSLVSITEGHDQMDALNIGGIAFGYGIKSTAGAINNTTISAPNRWNLQVVATSVVLAPKKPDKTTFFMFMQ